MTLGDLLGQARLTLDDSVGTDTELLWSDPELVHYINDGYDKMCERARTLIIDSTTAEDEEDTPLPLCTLPIVKDQKLYDYSKKILTILRVKVSGHTRPLSPVTTNWLDNNISDWENTTIAVRYYCTDYQPGKLLLVGTPTSAGTASLRVGRRPLVALTASEPDAVPELPEEYHEDVLPWVYFRAFSKQDVETLNKMKASEWFAAALDRWGRIYQQHLNRDYNSRGIIAPPAGAI